MKARTLLLWLVGVWLVVEILVYALLVPSVLSMTGFAYVSAVLLVLLLVVISRWRQAGPGESIEEVLYEVEHPQGGQKNK